MKIAILSGGFGTRIRDVSEDIPKPMITIGNYPILWHIMKLYSHYGFNDFLLCLGYKSHVIKNYFLNYRNLKSDFLLDLERNQVESLGNPDFEKWKITFAETGLNSNTGARVYRVKKYLESEEYFALTYGDGIANLDIHELVKFHKSHGRLMTVTGVRPPGRFGELEIDNDRVVGFNEKPQASGGWISGGFFICSSKIFKYLNSNEDLIFEREPIEKITRDGELMVFKHDGFWHPMDTSREYQLLNELWNSGEAPWKVWI
jgi:glucose-1-phosphate cytidylyltransferase